MNNEVVKIDPERAVTRSFAKIQQQIKRKIISANKELPCQPNPEDNKRTQSTSLDRQKQVAFQEIAITQRSKSTSTDLQYTLNQKKAFEQSYTENVLLRIPTQTEQETYKQFQSIRRRRVSSDSDVSGAQPKKVLNLNTSKIIHKKE